MEVGYWVLLGIGIGLIIGYFIGLKCPQEWDGVFRVDLTNPEKDIFTLELICPLGEIPTKKFLRFKVLNIRSQEKQFL